MAYSKVYSRCFGRYEGEEIRLMLWDTAGQEEFDAITKAYYRGTTTYTYEKCYYLIPLEL